MHAYQQSNCDALTELVHKLPPQMQRFFREMTATRPDADDLLQEFWLRLHRARHTYRHDRPLLPWVYAIARHTRADGYRRLLRNPAVPGLELDLFPDRKSVSNNSESRVDLERLIATLPDGQKQVITMLKFAGMTLEEVARATGTTVGGVKQKAHRAYVRMRSRIAGRHSRTRRPDRELALVN